MTFEHALEFTLEHYSDKHQKKRIKAKLNDIYSTYIQGQEFEKKVTRQNKFFSLIGWE